MPAQRFAPPKKNIESFITSAVPEQVGISRFGMFCAEEKEINTLYKKTIVLRVIFIIQHSTYFVLILQLNLSNASAFLF